MRLMVQGRKKNSAATRMEIKHYLYVFCSELKYRKEKNSRNSNNVNKSQKVVVAVETI